MDKDALKNLLDQGSSEDKLDKLLKDMDRPSIRNRTPEVESNSNDNDNLYPEEDHKQLADLQSALVESSKSVKPSSKEIFLSLLEKYNIKSMKELRPGEREKFLKELNETKELPKAPEILLEKQIPISQTPEMARAKLIKKNEEKNLANAKAQEAVIKLKKSQELAQKEQPKDPLMIKNSIKEDVTDTPSDPNSFKVTLTTKDGEKQEVDVKASSEEDARKEVLNIIDVKPEGVEKIEKKQELEPEVIAPEEPKKYDENKSEEDIDDMKNKELMKQVQESFDSLFSIFKEEVGEVAVEPVHDDSKPEELKPEEKTEDVYPSEDHEQAEDVKEVIAKEVGEVAVQPVHDDSKPEELEPQEETKDVYPADEHEQAEEVKEVIVETETVEVPADAEADVKVSNDMIKIEIPLEAEKEKVKKELPEEEAKEVNEALRVIYSTLKKHSLNEEENVEIPEDAEAEVKVEDDKLVIEIPVESPKDEVNEKEEKAIKESVAILSKYLKEEVGEAAAEPVHDESKPEELKPEEKTEDVYPSEDHEQAEEVKEVIVESKKEEKKAEKLEAAKHVKAWKMTGVYAYKDGSYTYGDGSPASKEDIEKYNKFLNESEEVGEAAAEPVHDDSEPEELEPKVDTEDVYPSEDHEQAEEIDEIIIEGKKYLRKDLIQLFENFNLNTHKYTIEYLLEELGEVAVEPVHDDSEPEELEPEVETEDVYPSEDHEQAEEIEEVIVESEDVEVSADAEAEVKVSDDMIRIEIPLADGEKISKESDEKEEEIIKEAIRIVHGILSNSKLNEDESFEVPADAEAEVKVEDDKLIVEIPAEKPKEEVSEEEKKKLDEAIDVLSVFLKEEVGEAAAEPVHDDSKPEELKPEEKTEDVYPSEDHEQSEEVKEIIVEMTNFDALQVINELTKLDEEKLPEFLSGLDDSDFAIFEAALFKIDNLESLNEGIFRGENRNYIRSQGRQSKGIEKAAYHGAKKEVKDRLRSESKNRIKDAKDAKSKAIAAVKANPTDAAARKNLIDARSAITRERTARKVNRKTAMKTMRDSHYNELGKIKKDTKASIKKDKQETSIVGRMGRSKAFSWASKAGGAVKKFFIAPKGPNASNPAPKKVNVQGTPSNQASTPASTNP